MLWKKCSASKRLCACGNARHHGLLQIVDLEGKFHEVDGLTPHEAGMIADEMQMYCHEAVKEMFGKLMKEGHVPQMDGWFPLKEN